MREYEMIVRERNTKHGAGQHHHNGALDCDCFLGIQHIAGGFSKLRGMLLASHVLFETQPASPTDKATTDENRRRQRRSAVRPPEDADALHADALH